MIWQYFGNRIVHTWVHGPLRFTRWGNRLERSESDPESGWPTAEVAELRKLIVTIFRAKKITARLG